MNRIAERLINIDRVTIAELFFPDLTQTACSRIGVITDPPGARFIRLLLCRACITHEVMRLPEVPPVCPGEEVRHIAINGCNIGLAQEVSNPIQVRWEVAKRLLDGFLRQVFMALRIHNSQSP